MTVPLMTDAFSTNDQCLITQAPRFQPLHSKRRCQNHERSAVWYVACGTLFLRQAEGCYETGRVVRSSFLQSANVLDRRICQCDCRVTRVEVAKFSRGAHLLDARILLCCSLASSSSPSPISSASTAPRYEDCCTVISMLVSGHRPVMYTVNEPCSGSGVSTRCPNEPVSARVWTVQQHTDWPRARGGPPS